MSYTMAGADGKSWSPWGWEINKPNLTDVSRKSDTDRDQSAPEANSVPLPIWDAQCSRVRRGCLNTDPEEFRFDYRGTFNLMEQPQVTSSTESVKRPSVLSGVWLDPVNRENLIPNDFQRLVTCQDCLATAFPKFKCRACNGTLCFGCARAHWRESRDQEIFVTTLNVEEFPRSNRKEQDGVQMRFLKPECRDFSVENSPLNHSFSEVISSSRVCLKKTNFSNFCCNRGSMLYSEANSISKASSKIDLAGKAHNSGSSSFYCQTCSDIVCNFCIPIDHVDHDLCFLQESMRRAAMVSLKLVDLARTGVETSAASIGTATQRQKSLVREYQALKTKIEHLMNEFRVHLDRRERELLSVLSASLTLQSKMVMNEISVFKTIFSVYSGVSSVLADVIGKTEPVDILQVATVCSHEVNRAKDLQERAVFPSSALEFVYPDVNLLLSISKMGKVLFEQNQYGPIGDKSVRSRNAVRPSSDETCSDASFTVHINSSSPRPGHVECPVERFLSLDTVFGYSHVGKPALIFGRNGGNDGEFRWPWGICCTAEGNMIVADRCNHRVQIFNKEGKFISQFGQYGKTEPGTFDRPAGVALGRSGRIVVTDKDNHRVQVFSQFGDFIFKFGREGSMNGQFLYPWDLAVNSNGEILVSDTKNFRIQLFTSDGVFLNKFTAQRQSEKFRYFSPRGICFDSEGKIFVADFNNHRVLVVDPDFQTYRSIGEPGTGCKQLLRPQGVAVDNQAAKDPSFSGNVVVTDSKNDRIQVFTTGGNYVFQFGTHGTNEGQFDRPSGVCFTPDGRTAIVDFKNNRVQMF